MHRHLSLVATLALLACAPPPRSQSTAPDPGAVATSQEELCLCYYPTYAGLLATFQVGSETYRQEITNRDGIEEALALWKNPKVRKKIPIGDLRCGCSGWNCAWSFYVEPSSLRFTEGAIELCDGAPSWVSSSCRTFGPTYCPWEAQLVELRDCRSGADCPIVRR